MKNTIVLLFLLLLFAINAKAAILDKIVAIVDEEVITLSEVKRINQTLLARKNISPFIYSKDSYSQEELVDIIIQRKMVRDRLSEMGYVINDDQVESQIKSTERRLGLTRNNLLEFLRSKQMSFDEYFELTRESIEHNLFTSRIIAPLISITEQEIKNEFYKRNANNNSLTLKYSLVDFSIEQGKVNKKMLANMKETFTKFQNTGELPNSFSSMETTSLGQVEEEGLDKNLYNLLKKTDEGAFSEPILLGGRYHVFYVKRKDLVESSIYNEAKAVIKNKLMTERALKMTDLWYKREESKHYIKVSI